MKTLLIMIMLLMLFAATGCGGGGSTVAPPTSTQRPATLQEAFAAVVGSYTWTGSCSDSSGSIEIGPYSGRIEMAAEGIRVVIETSDQPRTIDVLFLMSEAELGTGVYLWTAHSGAWPVPRGGYLYRLDLMLSSISDKKERERHPTDLILQESHMGYYGGGTSSILVGVRQ